MEGGILKSNNEHPAHAGLGLRDKDILALDLSNYLVHREKKKKVKIIKNEIYFIDIFHSVCTLGEGLLRDQLSLSPNPLAYSPPHPTPKKATDKIYAFVPSL